MIIQGSIQFNYNFKEYTADQLDQADELAVQGIYVLKDADDAVLYVGQSKHVGQRLQTHLQGSGRSSMFSNKIHRIYVLIDIPLTELDLIEHICIHKLKPMYNVHSFERSTCVKKETNLSEELLIKIFYLSENLLDGSPRGVSKHTGISPKAVERVLQNKASKYRNVYVEYKKRFPRTRFEEINLNNNFITEFAKLYEEMVSEN